MQGHIYMALFKFQHKWPLPSTILKSYKNTLDGILVWVAMQTEKDNDGNRDMKIQRLLNKSHQVYDRITLEAFYSTAMTLRQYMRNLRNSMLKLLME